MLAKVILYGVLITIGMVIYSAISSLIAVVVVPVLSNSTTDDIWKIFLFHVEPQNILRQFIWSLPIGLSISAIARYIYFKRKLN